MAYTHLKGKQNITHETWRAFVQHGQHIGNALLGLVMCLNVVSSENMLYHELANANMTNRLAGLETCLASVLELQDVA
jgi:hypothetical protein